MTDKPQQPTQSGAPRRSSIGLVVTLVVVIIAAIFILQNTDSVKIEFLFVNTEWPLWLVIVVSMILGAALMWGTQFYMGRRARKKAKANAKKK